MIIDKMIENGKAKLEEARAIAAKQYTEHEAELALAAAEREKNAIEIVMREMGIPSEFAGLMKVEEIKTGTYSADLVVSINVPGCVAVHLVMDYSGYTEKTATGIRQKCWVVAHYWKERDYSDGLQYHMSVRRVGHDLVTTPDLEVALALAAENYKAILVMEAEIEQENKQRVAAHAPRTETDPNAAKPGVEEKLLAALREFIVERAREGMEA